MNGLPPRYADDLERYLLDDRIAVGGMGEVWRATDTVLHRPVAVKLLKAELADDPEFRTRFETEARHAASLHHPGIAAVFDFSGTTSTDHPPYLVMELVDGQPLSALLRRGHPMPADSAADLGIQVADALGAAHAAGIVHRDVKPANLIVTPDRRVKVTDFGIARAADGVPLTRTGQVMGTPQYLSPEQAEGGIATTASDVYALGVVLFEALAGARPFDADSPVATALAHIRQPVPELPAHVPSDLAAVVHRCLAKDPSERYADGAALAIALRDPKTAATRIGAVAPRPAATAAVPVAPSLGVPIDPPTAVLQALPPASADLGDPVRPRERSSGAGMAWFWAALVGALIVLIAWLLWKVSSGEQTPTPQPTASVTVTAEPTETTVTLPESVCVGSLDDVVASIERRELVPDPVEETNPGTEVENSVVSCAPTGELEEGDTVTVTYWGPAPEPSETPSESPSETPSDTPTPSDSTSGSPAVTPEAQQ